MKLNGDLEFYTAGAGEAKNFVIERMTTTARTALGNVAGQIVYDTDVLAYFFNNGTGWNQFGSSGTVTNLQAEVDAIETASGGIFDTDGTYNAATLDALNNVSASTDLANALSQLDTAISNAAGVDTLGELTDVTLSTPSNTDLLQFNGTEWVNVSATTIGEFGFKTISGDSGADVVADQLGDTLTFNGIAGGVNIVADSANDTLDLNLAPMSLSATSATIDGADFLMLSDAADAADAAPLRTSLTKIITDLDIVTATADGVLVRTAADTYASRTLTAATTGLEGITIADGDGILGDPTFGLNITGLTAEAGTLSASDSFVVFDGTNNVKVTLSQLAAGITAAAPLSIDDLSDVVITGAASGEFLTFDGTNWVDTTPADSRTAMDVYSKSESDSTFVDVAGDTMSGNLAMGNNLVSGLAAPTTDDHAANKAYVDSKVAGLTWKNSVDRATTSNITLSGIQNIDGSDIVDGMRVLVKDQTNAAENGIYIASTSGAWTRATDMDSTSPVDEINSAAVFVENGNTQADTGWTVTSPVSILDTDDIVWTQFNGASGITAGVGLGKSGNTVFVNMGAGIVQLPSDEVGVHVRTAGGLITTLDGTTSSTDSAAELAILVDGNTLSLSSTGIKVASGGITEVELNTSVAGDGITGGAGTALSLDLKVGSGLVIDTGELSLTSVPNTALANSTLSFTDGTNTAVSNLGDTLTFAAGNGLSIVVNGTGDSVTYAMTAGINELSDVDTTTTAPTSGDALIFDGTNWVPGEATNHETADLSDVGAAASAAGQIMVSDGSNVYQPIKIQHVETVTVAATTWTVSHNLGQKFVNVTVYDSTDQQIIPQSVTLTDANTTTITFNTAITGSAVIMGVKGI
jgi:hypothetical protein